jgi:hypothetical protein
VCRWLNNYQQLKEAIEAIDQPVRKGQGPAHLRAVKTEFGLWEPDGLQVLFYPETPGSTSQDCRPLEGLFSDASPAARNASPECFQGQGAMGVAWAGQGPTGGMAHRRGGHDLVVHPNMGYSFGFTSIE